MLALAVTACGGSDNNPNNPTPTPQGPANLVIEDVTIGTGAEATGGRLLTVTYILYLYDPAGSGGRGQLLQGPAQFQFRQGTNAVIPGFELGTASMLVGGVRRITDSPVARLRGRRQPQGRIPGELVDRLRRAAGRRRRLIATLRPGSRRRAPPNRVAATSPATISAAPIAFHRSIGSCSQIAAVPTAATGIRFE